MAMQTNASTHTDRGTVVGVFHGQAEAQRAIRELKSAGFEDSEIGVASHDSEGAYSEHTETEGEGDHSGTGAAMREISARPGPKAMFFSKVLLPSNVERSA